MPNPMIDGQAPPRHSGATTPTSIPLLDLAPGAIGILREVVDQQSRAVLRSLGLTDGARLRICRIGDPCIIQVRSTRIGLSKQVAQSVYVAVAEGSAW
jgi:Fe2+ transport system protein FeoA